MDAKDSIGGLSQNQSIQNGQPVSPVQPVEQTQVEQPQSQRLSASPSEEQLAKNKPKISKKLMTIVAVAVISAVVIVVIVIILLSSGGERAALKNVRKYCEEKQLQISEGTIDTEPKAQYISCQSTNYYGGDSDDDNMVINFSVYDKSAMEYEELVSIRDLMSELGETLKQSSDYAKIYLASDNNVEYFIFDGRTYIHLTARSDDTAKDALIAMGYSDSNWPIVYEGIDIKEGSSLSKQASRNDAKRRNDMARLDTALVQYRTNNSNLPEGPSYWIGIDDFANCENNIACQLIRDYVNTDGEINSFLDPDGFLYSIYITENIALNDNITMEFGNDYSRLVKGSNGYMIGGTFPFNEFIAYILPGGTCSEGGGVVKSQVNHFAIMYVLDNNSTYCISDQ